MTKQTTRYLQSLSDKLLDAPLHKIIKANGWASDFPTKAGVYIIRKKGKVIYVGETGSIKGRMKDLTRTVNHTARRTIGTEKFANHAEYTVPTTSKKFCETLEDELNKYFAKHLTISFLVVELGRKELEEMICNTDDSPVHNKKKGRK